MSIWLLCWEWTREARFEAGRPVRRLLSWSRQEMTVACTRIVVVEAVRSGQTLDTF